MNNFFNISINLSKIDAAKVVTGKTGDFLNLTIAINDEPDQFGNDISVWQSQSKTEREAKEPRNYLGNGKTFKFGAQTTPEKTDSDLSKEAKKPFWGKKKSL